MFGALNAKEFEPLSLNISLFATLLVLLIVMAPLTDCAPELIVPVVLIIVDPSISEEPLIVPVVRVALVSVLLDKVS